MDRLTKEQMEFRRERDLICRIIRYHIGVLDRRIDELQTAIHVVRYLEHDQLLLPPAERATPGGGGGDG